MLIAAVAQAQEKQTIVKGTKCTIDMPKDFQMATKFHGIEHTATGSSILITEFPSSYEELTASLTGEALSKRGVIVDKIKDTTINSIKGRIVHAHQESGSIIYLKRIYVFGSATYSVLAMGTFPMTSKLEPTILPALYSVKYNDAANENPEAAAKYSIDAKNTAFRFTKSLSGTLLYTTDNKIPSDGDLFMISNSSSPAQVDNRRLYAEERLKTIPGGANYILDQTAAITIDGLQGYEVLAHKITPKEKEYAYEVILFDAEGRYYLMLGITSTESKNYDQRFRSLAQTFKRR